MAASTFLVAPALLRPRGASPPATCCCCCRRCSAQRGGLIPRPSARGRSPSSAHPVRLCVNAGAGWPVVPRGSSNRRFEKGLRAAATDADASGQVGDDDEDMARVTNEALRATLRKSKEVLARHKIILEQIAEKKKLISVLVESSIHNEQEPHSGQSDNSFSHLNAASEGEEIDYEHQTYLATHAQQSEFEATYGDDQSEYYESLEDEDTDFSGSFGEVNYGNYKFDSFPSAGPSVYQPEAANGMNQHYVAQLSQVRENDRSVSVGENDNSSASGDVDLLNIILVAAECAPWSKTGKNKMI